MSKTGIIYKLVSRDINIKEIYIGSTLNFRTRKCNHRKACNNENNKCYGYNIYQYIRSNGGWDSFDMIQIEEFKHDTKRELHARERYWIEELKASLNKVIPTRTDAEYRENNKDKITNRMKQYYQANKEKITEQHKQYELNNKEYLTEKRNQYQQNNKDAIKEQRKQYRENNKPLITNAKKQYYQTNKERIAEQKKQKYTCGCGSHIRISDKAKHNISAKHIAWATSH